MKPQQQLTLPRDLGDGLVLRWATPDDTEEVAQFNSKIHSDNPEKPDINLANWTRDLMNGTHPTTKADDFTVVVDQNAGGKIVSTLNLISQTWGYEDILFPVGRPELVGTLVEYRRRGLVRLQMEAIHAKSAARGELVMAITGIPWYYRQFGYEMAIDLGGSRQLFWARPGNDKTLEKEVYKMRPATTDDIPILADLYKAHLGNSLIWRVRDDTLWHYEMTGTNPDFYWALKPKLIETLSGEPIAYVDYSVQGTSFGVNEIGVKPGHSWRAVGTYLARTLRQEAAELNKTREKQITNISFNLRGSHQLYEAMGNDLERQIRPYAWYVRVPDIPAFIRHIGPALERRLAVSVLAGHSGTVKINLYRSRFTMVWESGRLIEVGDTYEYSGFEDGDALFPEHTFLQLLFGHRSIEELFQSYIDCEATSNEIVVLLEILFPKRPSQVIPFG